MIIQCGAKGLRDYELTMSRQCSVIPKEHIDLNNGFIYLHNAEILFSQYVVTNILEPYSL